MKIDRIVIAELRHKEPGGSDLRDRCRWRGSFLALALAGLLVGLFAPPLGAQAPEEGPSSARSSSTKTSTGVPTNETLTDTGETYQIRLRRPSKVGDRFEFEASVVMLQEEGFFGDEEMFDGSHNTAEASIVADTEVLEVDETGGITRAEYTVKSFFGKLRGEEIHPVEVGAVIVAESTERGTSLSLKEGRLSQAQTVILAQIIETAAPGAPSDDDLFGPDEAKSIGAIWPVNREQVAEAFARGSLLLLLDQTDGAVKLKSRSTVNGVDCLSIAGAVEAHNVIPGDVKPEEVESSSIRLQFKGDYPLDHSVQALRGEIETTYEVVLVFDDGRSGEPEEGVGPKISTRQLTETKKSFEIRPYPASEGTASGEAAPTKDAVDKDAAPSEAASSEVVSEDEATASE